MSSAVPHYVYRIFFFFNDTATTEIYTLSLHDALPIFRGNGADGPGRQPDGKHHPCPGRPAPAPRAAGVDVPVGVEERGAPHVGALRGRAHMTNRGCSTNRGMSTDPHPRQRWGDG